MLIEAPRKRAKGVNRPETEPSVGNSTRALTAPRRKGAMMLTPLTVAAVWPRPLIRRTSSSRPTRNMKKISPTWASTSRKGSIWSVNTKWLKRGSTAPSTEGPSTMPATISPTTWGWLMRWNRAPATRATTITSTADRSSFHTIAPVSTASLGPPAAPAGLGAGSLRPAPSTSWITTSPAAAIPP